MRSMGHVEKTAAFRQRRAAETARWRERLQRGAGVEISVVSFARPSLIHPHAFDWPSAVSRSNAWGVEVFAEG